MCSDINMEVKGGGTPMLVSTTLKFGYKNKKKTCSETSRGFKEI
jgi:hypothetical protein